MFQISTLWLRLYCTLTEGFLNLTEVFPCFFLSCKANARVKLAKTEHGPYSSTLVVICLVRLFVLFNVLFVCKWVLPPGDKPIAVNKYISGLYIRRDPYLVFVVRFGSQLYTKNQVRLCYYIRSLMMAPCSWNMLPWWCVCILTIIKWCVRLNYSSICIIINP
jgi:hypothetical protein